MSDDIVVKRTDPVSVAVADDIAPGFGHDNINPSFNRILPTVLARLALEGATPGICIAWYEQPTDDGRVVVHAGFDVSAAGPITGDDAVHIVDLPVVEVASIVHAGAMDDVEPVYERLFRWIDDSGYAIAGLSRELYHEFNADDPSKLVTELQMPITRN